MKVRTATPDLDNGINDIVMVIPSIERGHFIQYYSACTDLGQIALLSKVPEEEAESIRQGDEMLFQSYYEEDEGYPGRLNILRGAKISVVRNALSGMSMTPNALETSAMYGNRAIDEFAPYTSNLPPARL